MWVTPVEAAALEREATAYHEAGHALLDVLNRRRFRYITLRPREKYQAGHVLLTSAPDARVWLRESSSLFAGLIAEDLWEQGKFEDHDHADCRSEIVRASGRIDLCFARDLICRAWTMSQVDPGWPSDPIEPGWSPQYMAVKAWDASVRQLAAHADALNDLAQLIHESPRAVTWRQACEVVAANEAQTVTDAELAEVDMLRPWFLDHCELTWQPSEQWIRQTIESAGPIAARTR